MNASRGFFRFTLALLSVVALAAPAAAQATIGEITGRVLDARETAVPGATVTARNEGTGLTRTRPPPAPTGTTRSPSCRPAPTRCRRS